MICPKVRNRFAPPSMRREDQPMEAREKIKSMPMHTDQQMEVDEKDNADPWNAAAVPKGYGQNVLQLLLEAT